MGIQRGQGEWETSPPLPSPGFGKKNKKNKY